jgi:hypothetical protein
MMTFYCPKCWGEVRQENDICPHCAAEIQTVLDQRNYIGKLIAALSNPEPGTPLRAAWLLGQLRARSAVGAILDVLQGGADPYVNNAAVKALGEFGEASTESVLAELAEQGPILQRGEA